MSKYCWSQEQANEANKKLKPDVIMYDGMSGRPFAVCFPFYFAGYFITTPNEWRWLQNKFENYEHSEKEISEAGETR